MKDECLICGAPLKYLAADEPMECVLCHKKENSKTVCEKGIKLLLATGQLTEGGAYDVDFDHQFLEADK